MSQRILYYNWAPYFQDPVVGGGVSVYCRNLLDHLSAGDHGYEPSFLYSGFDYSAISRGLRVERVRNRRHPGVPTFSFVNSPIPAPSILSFDDPEGALANDQVEDCFNQFLKQEGPFQLIHFHNLEGITATCLRVARESGAKVVFSLHNYWAMCPQVHLWQFDSRPCTDYMEGRGCASCLTDTVETDLILAQRTLGKKASFSMVARRDAPLGLRMWAAVRSRDHNELRTEPRLRPGPLQAPLVVEGSQLPQRAPLYRRRREGIVDLINRDVDVALSVSERTAEIYEDYGVRPERLRTLYIGSDAARFQAPSGNPASRSPGDLMRLVYLGESRREKGFHFLLQELRQLPSDALRSLDLTIACRVTDQAELRMAAEHRGLLLSLAEALGRFTYHPGYSREDLPGILQGVHLGIVPALWEDNLPQVTLELLACRVPVLCSDRGGAQEFVRHPAFIYDPDKAGDFRSRLRDLQQVPTLLDDFWRAARLPRTMDQHFAELVDVYRGPSPS